MVGMRLAALHLVALAAAARGAPLSPDAIAPESDGGLVSSAFKMADFEEFENDMGIPHEESTDLMQESTAAEKLQAKKVLKSMADLRAYCILAQEKAQDYEDRHRSTGIVDFISEFGNVEYSKPTPP